MEIGGEPTIFCRAGQLVDIITLDGVPKFRELPLAILRDRLTAVARFVRVKETEEGDERTPSHPPEWLVKAVAARGLWPGVRQLNGVVTVPTLRSDGTILNKPGYDPQSGLLYSPDNCTPDVLEIPTPDDAIRACNQLLEIVAEFPFKTDAHRATWLAYLLTPLARHAFEGPSPLFLLDANVRASGKSLLADIVSLVVVGTEAQRFANPDCDEECRKRITAVVLENVPLLLIDNITGSLGCPSLDAALTGTIWKDRELGKNRNVEGPLRTVWSASGNNVVLEADTARRVAHVRLESPEENPELREGFKFPDIKQHVAASRSTALAIRPHHPPRVVRSRSAAGAPAVLGIVRRLVECRPASRRLGRPSGPGDHPPGTPRAVRSRSFRCVQLARWTRRSRRRSNRPAGIRNYLKAGEKSRPLQANKAREFFVTREMAAKVSEACPDTQWRLLFALSRFGGLRCPSEHLALRWCDVHWPVPTAENDKDRAGWIRITSSKTEHHEGKGERIIPMFDELKPYLDAAWDEATEREGEFVITRYRDANSNLRTQLERIIGKAGLESWPKLFQNFAAPGKPN